MIDATVISCTVKFIKRSDVALLSGSDWNLKKLTIEEACYRETLSFLPNALIKKFPLLESLKLFECSDVEALPENIGELLIHLTDLKIYGGGSLSTLPPSLGQLTNLELSNCFAMTLEGFAPLKQLQQLKTLEILRSGDSEEVSLEWICNNVTTGLLELRFGNPVHSLPSTISNLKHLTSLVLEDSCFPELPDSIGMLSLLQNLEISNNGHPDEIIPLNLPESFSKLTSLEELDLTVNLDGIAPLQHLTGLTNLLLEFYTEHNFQNLDVIWNLTSLKRLYLADETSELSEDELLQLPAYFSNLKMPDDIANLKNLKYLHIEDFINLHELPESIGTLSCLTKLELMCTGVKSLPDTIVKLNALKVLQIVNCYELTAIPESFADRVLGENYEDWSLEKVVIWGCDNLVLSPKMEQAMEVLKSRGVLVDFRAPIGHQ